MAALTVVTASFILAGTAATTAAPTVTAVAGSASPSQSDNLIW